MNLVLDDVQEMLRGMSLTRLRLHAPSCSAFALPACIASTELNVHADDEGNTSTRSLGLIVARGTLLVLISPLDGSEEIANPFNNQDED